ncbi:unnamed protein product [Orchesella dallaii]|uniref:Uncharacterized protein n=1 Tax=Orchesella dallaii TaxID=48710 RepID=A0ABP1PKK9_9HEXA
MGKNMLLRLQFVGMLIVNLIIKCESSCVCKLFPHINDKWEEYVIYFIKTESHFGGRVAPSDCMRSRVLSLDNNNVTGLSRGNYRYSDTFNVIISPQDITDQYVNFRYSVLNLGQVVVPTRSLFLFIWTHITVDNGVSTTNMMLAKWHTRLLTLNTSLALSFVALHEFDRFDSMAIVYCTTVKEGEGNFLVFAVWYEPFTVGIWVGVLSIIGFSCFYSFKHYRKGMYFVLVELVGYVGNIFGASTKARYFVFSCAVGFLLSQIYVNGLTSIITVFLPPKGLDTVKQFLEAGYKILSVSTPASLPAEYHYAQDFKRLQLPIEKAFHTVHNVNVTTVDDLLVFMAGKNARYGFIHPTSIMKSTTRYATKVFQTINNALSTCFALQDTFHKTETNLVIKTENKQHLTTTLHRIVASGLDFKWDQWSEWHFMLTEMLLEQHTPAQSDVIDIRKFASMFFVWISFIVFCLGVFAVETGVFTFLLKIILGSHQNRIRRIGNTRERKKQRERRAQKILFHLHRRQMKVQQRSRMVRDGRDMI